MEPHPKSSYDASLLKIAWQVYSQYFIDESIFHDKYESLDDKSKRVFLHTVKKYFYLVYDVEIRNKNPHFSDLDFIAEGYKFISIISLIESLYAENEYKEFSRWLYEKDFPIQINSKNDLDALQKEYTNIYGCKKPVYKFFFALKDEIEQVTQENIIHYPKNIGEVEKHYDIKNFSDLLYDIRSKFLHAGTFIVEFSDDEVISKRQGKILSSTLNLGNISRMFELGLLHFFGIQPDSIPKLSTYSGFIVDNS